MKVFKSFLKMLANFETVIRFQNMGSIKPACLENYCFTKEYHAKRINIKRIL